MTPDDRRERDPRVDPQMGDELKLGKVAYKVLSVDTYVTYRFKDGRTASRTSVHHSEWGHKMKNAKVIHAS